eukprot:m.142933 g.142933  ORF g.142933 m.142933 type:complete len:93 (-) comp14075_c0_seq1:1420-1698(-)
MLSMPHSILPHPTTNTHTLRTGIACLCSGQRKLSLRFLAWYLLNISVQTDSAFGHDSVEDSVTALKVQEFVCIVQWHLVGFEGFLVLPDLCC